ncbi:MAG: aspartate kinase [Armatimonadetes bacterium]|nr:aspartate kinase [Armatimonadota bacterium]
MADLFGAEASTTDRPVRSLVIQKYGGSTVADADRIRKAADRVAQTRRTGDDVVVVVSAMGNTTDELIALANSINPAPPPREMDMLLSTGEQTSIALLSMALGRQGVEAVSLTGSQVGIITDRAHRRARIRRIDREKIMSHLRAGRVVVVAGFQGRESGGDLTTLGPGGADTTAVAVAAALRADRCEVYTHVEGVFTADPRVIPEARLIRRIPYDEMLEMADLGTRVLQPRAVEVAKRFGVTLVVRSSFSHDPGTQVGGGDDMEEVIIRAVTHSCDEIKLVLEAVPDVPGVAARVFRALADAGVKVDMILQGMHHEGRNDIAFTVVRENLDDARRVCQELAVELGARRVGEDAGIAKVSVVGAGISQDAGVAASMFEALAEEGINIDMISTSPLRISCVIARDRAEDAVGALHRRFNLSG